MQIKYTNKTPQIGNFGLKTNHLATLTKMAKTNVQRKVVD
jgi:hypothetical protein